MKNAMPFLVVGHARSGTGFLRSSIDSHSQAVCLGELLHAHHEDVRIANHRNFFGDDGWLRFAPGMQNTKHVIEYLEGKIWPESRLGRPFGFKLLFWQIDYLNLWKYLSQKGSSLKIISITRNPIAVFVSKEQAVETNQWARGSNESAIAARPILIDLTAFNAHTKEMLQYEKRIQKIAKNTFTVSYESLVNHYQTTMNQVFEFLELKPHQANPSILKQQNWNISARISNFEEFSKKLKKRYRPFLESML